MKIATLLFMCFAVVGIPARAAQPSGDSRKLQYEWGAVAYIDNGEDAFGEKIDANDSPVKWLFKKDKVHFLADVEEATAVGKFTLDSKAKPCSIDCIFPAPNDPNKSQVLKGIYELKGDRLKVCYGVDTENRPKDFASEVGSKLIYIEFGKVTH